MQSLFQEHLVFIFLLYWIGSGGEANIVLTHVPVEVEENRSVVLSCYSTGDPKNGIMSWARNGLIFGVNLTDSPCRAITDPLNRTDVYTLNCSDIHNIKLTVRNVDRLQHGDQWQCFIGFSRSNVVTLYVKVPVGTLDLKFTDQDIIAENQTSRFQCTSSFSRPKPEIFWFLSNGTTAFYDDIPLNSNISETLVYKTVGNRTGNILTSTESELVLKVHRSMNNQQLYCLTNDTSGRVLRSTLETLDISYPPDGPPYILGSGNTSTYSIINTFQGNMTCIVNGGNPLPNVNWTCLQSGTQTMWRSNTTVASYFIWTASMDNSNMTCTCKSLYLEGQSTASVNINVLHPPSLPEFNIQSKLGGWQKVSSGVNIKENNSLTIKCSSESNPVSTFSWTGPSSTRSNNETLKVSSVNNRTEGMYTCTARNIMIQTNGTSLEGIKNKSIRVDVLYPPSDITFTIRNQSTDISVSKTVNMLENISYILTCHARGKPEPAYSWTGPVNVSSDVLHFTNISRQKAGYYTCVAKNTINESTGNIYNEQENKTIYLNIQYPPDPPRFYYLMPDMTNEEIFNSTFRVVKKDNISILCNSTGKPPPISAWNRTESSNILPLNAIETDASYTCTSSNVMIETEGGAKNGLKSERLNIHVLYPPVKPIIKIIQLEEYVEALDVVNAVENTNISLKCLAESKPPPNFSWSHPVKEVISNSSKQLFVNRIQRNQSGTYTCHAANEMVRSFGNVEVGRNERSIYVDVLYPPNTSTFYYIALHNKQNINTLPLKVVEGDNVNVLCNATGNPTPTSLWINSVTDTDILSIVSVNISHLTNFTCKSFNIMNDAFGMSSHGTSSNNFSIVVFHSPRNPVIQIQMHTDSTKEAPNNTGILEGSNFRLYCHAVGNPSPSYKWAGAVTGNSAELFVSNIQRNQSGPYICFVHNEMERSFGNNEIGRNSRSIFFNVLYKAAILYFGGDAFETITNMTINQGEEVRIICKVESNPFSNSTIFFKGRLLNETIRSDIVTYNLINSTCSDAGRYICKGKNEYNYEAEASKEFFVYVKCLPQPSADQPPKKNVSAALSDSAVFRFHAAPYYDPGITEFRWFKQDNNRRILLRNDIKTYISSSDIHSVLRIIDISEADYGMYLLQYNNSVGINSFTFYLYQIDQTDSEETHRSKEENLPMVIGIVIAVLVIVGITLGLVIYIRRQKTDSNNCDRSYANICGMNKKSVGGNNINCEPVYEGIKPIHERGFVEMTEQTYDKLKPEDSPETKDPVYTNLKL